jgi:hypothetical protein
MCEPKNETGLCVSSEPRDGLPWADPTELPYRDDAVGPSKGQRRKCKALPVRRRT